MKKKPFLILILLIIINIVNLVQAQSVFLDAETIVNNLEKYSNDSTYALKINAQTTYVLDKYFTNHAYLDLDEFKEHPFLNVIIKVKEDTTYTPEREAFTFPYTLSGIDVTTYADALAQFMVTRAKEELSIAFFQRFQNEIRSNSNTELKILFPQTRSLLLSIGKDIYQFNLYLTSLREVFKNDLSNLYSNLPQLIRDEKYKQYFVNSPELLAIFDNSLNIINGLSNDIHPGEIIEKLTFDDFPSIDSSDVKGALQTIQFLSSSLKTKEGSNIYWVTPDKFVSDALTIRIYLGLLYQKEKIATIGSDKIYLNNKRLYQHMASLAENELELQVNFYFDFLNQTQLIQEYLEEIKEKKPNERINSDYYNYFKATFDLIEKIYAFADLHNMDMPTDSYIYKFTHSVNKLSEIYLSGNSQNYGSMIAHTISLLDTLLTDEFDSKAKGRLLRYGTFIANVATANSTEEVQNIISATALPSGSFRVKRNSRFTVSVNSYLGTNYLFEEDLYDAGRVDNTIGFYAPVGIEASFDFFFFENSASMSIFVSLIDIGAITRYRLNESDGTIDSTIMLGNIISPGASFIVGMPSIPVSLGGSFHSQPSLQYSKSDGFINIDRNKDNFGFSLFIAVDMPLFNVYTRPR